MSDEKKSALPIARVTVRAQTESTLESWRVQIQEVHPNFSPSDRELVEWAIERTPTLSKREILELRERFFDEVKELEKIVLKLRKAQAEGSDEVVKDLLATLPAPRKAPRPKLTQSAEK